jgi:hypothetical protein
MLLHDRQALELLGDNIQRVHRTTTTTDILDLLFLLAIIVRSVIISLELLIPPIFQASTPP